MRVARLVLLEDRVKISLFEGLIVGRWGWAVFLADLFVGQIRWPGRFIFVIFLYSISLALASHLNDEIGLSLWIGVPSLIVIVLLLVWALKLGPLLLFYPFPPCRGGQCCSINDYAWVVGRIYGREKWGQYRYWCKCCDDEYVRRGTRFLHVLPDGTERPYLKLVGFRNWQPDTTESDTDDHEPGNG